MTTAARNRRVKQWYSDLVSDLPEGCTILDAVIVVKYLDENGDSDFWCSATAGLSACEARGMADFAVEANRFDMMNYESGE